MITDRVALTDADKLSCERWLQSWRFCSARLTGDQFDTYSVLKLLKYELDSRRRKTAIDRLVSRYFKLRKREELEQIERRINAHNRKGRGETSGTES